MCRVSVSVEQLDDVLGTLHEGVVDALAHNHAAHGHGTRGDALCEGNHVRQNAVTFGGKRSPKTAEPGDHLVKNQKYSMLVADRSQALEVTLRRRQHAGRS